MAEPRPIFGRGGGWAHVVLGLYIEQESYFVRACVKLQYLFLQYQYQNYHTNIYTHDDKGYRKTETKEKITNALSTFHHTYAKHT